MDEVDSSLNPEDAHICLSSSTTVSGVSAKLERFYAKKDERLLREGIEDSMAHIMSLDTLTFINFRSDRKFTSRQKDLLSKIRREARKFRKRLQNASNNDLGSVKLRLDDLTKLLQTVGIQETAEDIMSMGHQDYCDYKTDKRFDLKQLSALSKPLVHKRLNRKGYESHVFQRLRKKMPSRKDVIRDRVELKYATSDIRLKKAGIQESMGYIMSLDRESYTEYRMNSGFSDTQKELLRKIRRQGKEINRSAKLSTPTQPANEEDLSLNLNDFNMDLEKSDSTEKAESIISMNTSKFRACQKGLSEEQKEVVSKILDKNEKATMEKVQQTLNKLKIPFTVDQLKKMDMKTYHRYVDDSYGKLKDYQKVALRRCMRLLRPEFLAKCQRKSEAKENFYSSGFIGEAIEVESFSFNTKDVMPLETSTISRPREIPLKLEDLDAELQALGVPKTAREIQEMDISDFRAFRKSINDEARSILLGIRRRINKRLRRKRFRKNLFTEKKRSLNHHNLSERLKEVGIEEDLEFLRGMTTEVFGEFLKYKKLDEDQEQVLLSVWSQIQEEKRTVEENVDRKNDSDPVIEEFKSSGRHVETVDIEPMPDLALDLETLLTGNPSDQPLKADVSETPPAHGSAKSPVNNEPTPTTIEDHQENVHEPRNKDNQPVLASKSDGSNASHVFEATPTPIEPSSPASVGHKENVQPLIEMMDYEPGMVRSSPVSLPDGYSDNPKDQPESSSSCNVHVQIKILEDGSKIFTKDSTFYPGHSFTYRFRPLENGQTTEVSEIYECASCIEVSSTYKSLEARQYVLDTIKTVKVRDEEVIEGDYDGLGHVCVPMELIRKRYYLA